MANRDIICPLAYLLLVSYLRPCSVILKVECDFPKGTEHILTMYYYICISLCNKTKGSQMQLLGVNGKADMFATSQLPLEAILKCAHLEVLKQGSSIVETRFALGTLVLTRQLRPLQ